MKFKKSHCRATFPVNLWPTERPNGSKCPVVLRWAGVASSARKRGKIAQRTRANCFFLTSTSIGYYKISDFNRVNRSVAAKCDRCVCLFIRMFIYDRASATRPHRVYIMHGVRGGDSLLNTTRFAMHNSRTDCCICNSGMWYYLWARWRLQHRRTLNLRCRFVRLVARSMKS